MYVFSVVKMKVETNMSQPAVERELRTHFIRQIFYNNDDNIQYIAVNLEQLKHSIISVVMTILAFRCLHVGTPIVDVVEQF